MKTRAFVVIFLMMSAAVSAQQPTTGYAPVNGLKMYYEIHGKGDPVVLLHGSFMTITNNWTDMIVRLSKSRQVIAVELQGHGRTADINRDFSFENLADDVAALLDYLKIKQADLLGYSMGGGVAMQVAIRHPEKVRKVVSISAVFRHDGWVKEAVEMFPQMDAAALKGSPIETEYKKLSPTPEKFETFVKRVIQMDIKRYDFGAGNLKATKAPFLFVHGDADGVRLDHIAEMFRLKGDEIFGDMRPRSESRLAILPNTTHITLMDKLDVIAPMVNDFLNAFAAGAPDAPSAPLHVVTQLYRDFGWEAGAGEPSSYKHDLIEQPKPILQRYFDDALTALILRDRQCVAKTQEVCNLDFAPLWNSQDPAATQLKIREGSAANTVVVSYRSPDGNETMTMVYLARKTSRGWRVSDIEYSSGNTLKGLLSQKD